MKDRTINQLQYVPGVVKAASVDNVKDGGGERDGNAPCRAVPELPHIHFHREAEPGNEAPVEKKLSRAGRQRYSRRLDICLGL